MKKPLSMTKLITMRFSLLTSQPPQQHLHRYTLSCLPVMGHNLPRHTFPSRGNDLQQGSDPSHHALSSNLRCCRVGTTEDRPVVFYQSDQSVQTFLCLLPIGPRQTLRCGWNWRPRGEQLLPLATPLRLPTISPSSLTPPCSLPFYTFVVVFKGQRKNTSLCYCTNFTFAMPSQSSESEGNWNKKVIFFPNSKYSVIHSKSPFIPRQVKATDGLRKKNIRPNNVKSGDQSVTQTAQCSHATLRLREEAKVKCETWVE